jgi:hypothetical protein
MLVELGYYKKKQNIYWIIMEEDSDSHEGKEEDSSATKDHVTR